MEASKKIPQIKPEVISELLVNHFESMLANFYEMQSSFLCDLYKRYKGIDSGNIILCLARNTHLEIIRMREKNLNHDVSLKNFWFNINSINKPTLKIISIVNQTGIPKETARRKIKQLMNKEYIMHNEKNKEYFWTLLPKHKNAYTDVVNREIEIISKFILLCSNALNLNFSLEKIKIEVKQQFSFYWYHFLSYELNWIKMWQQNIKDLDLILITLQTVIPALKYMDKKISLKEIGLENTYKLIGKTKKEKFSDSSVSATSISEITGLPRATCIRKLNKLVELEFLIKETKTKRFYINQSSGKSKKIITKEAVNSTIKSFSIFLSIVLNSIASS